MSFGINEGTLDTFHSAEHKVGSGVSAKFLSVSFVPKGCVSYAVSLPVSLAKFHVGTSLLR